jgi:hypothetical protein
MDEVTILWILLIIPFLSILGIVIFKWLWNITMPQVFNLRMITFWQAFRLLILSSFIFGAGSIFKFNMDF